MNNSELKARIGVCLGILVDTYGEVFAVNNVVVTFSETEGLFLWADFSDAPDKPEDFPIYLDDEREWSTYTDNTVQGYFVCKELPACYSSYSSFKFTYKEFIDWLEASGDLEDSKQASYEFINSMNKMMEELDAPPDAEIVEYVVGKYRFKSQKAADRHLAYRKVEKLLSPDGIEIDDIMNRLIENKASIIRLINTL